MISYQYSLICFFQYIIIYIYICTYPTYSTHHPSPPPMMEQLQTANRWYVKTHSSSPRSWRSAWSSRRTSGLWETWLRADWWPWRGHIPKSTPIKTGLWTTHFEDSKHISIDIYRYNMYVCVDINSIMLVVALSDKVPMAIKISYIYHKKRGVLLSQDFEGGQPWKLVRIQNSMFFPMANLTAPKKKQTPNPIPIFLD